MLMVLPLCLTACNETANSLSNSAGGSETYAGAVDGYATASDVSFWGTYSSVKVLQNLLEGYDNVKKEAAVSVAAIGGEEEASQIIMTTGSAHDETSRKLFPCHYGLRCHGTLPGPYSCSWRS